MSSLLLWDLLTSALSKQDDFIYPKLSSENERIEWYRLTRKIDLYHKAIEEGVGDFDFDGLQGLWELYHKKGWLCKYDYEVFEELKGMTP